MSEVNLGCPAPQSTRRSGIEGWTVHVKRDFLKRQPALAERTLTLLRAQLFQIARIVPAGGVGERLRTVRIWVEEDDQDTPCMAYHPGADWLREHHTNPAMAGGVELANARKFLDWTLEQPVDGPTRARSRLSPPVSARWIWGTRN